MIKKLNISKINKKIFLLNIKEAAKWFSFFFFKQIFKKNSKEEFQENFQKNKNKNNEIFLKYIRERKGKVRMLLR